MASRTLAKRAASVAFHHRFLVTKSAATARPAVVATDYRSSILQNSLFSQQSSALPRYFSDSSKNDAAEEENPNKPEEPEAAAAEKQKSEQEDEEEDPLNECETAPPTKESLLEKQVKDLKHQLLSSLAEQENVRRIAKRDVAHARDFAIKGFAKGLLDVADNLERALAAVPAEELLKEEQNKVLSTLYDGIKMTHGGLVKTFETNGLVKYGKPGELFDPNMHEALYEMPNPKKKPGTVGEVVKSGYKLNNRVLRSAEVGVIKKQQEAAQRQQETTTTTTATSTSS